jgi:hypothetical protein
MYFSSIIRDAESDFPLLGDVHAWHCALTIVAASMTGGIAAVC